MSILFAATYPERVSSLILGSAAARWFAGTRLPVRTRVRGDATIPCEKIAAHRWGQGATIDVVPAEPPGSPQARRWFARFERMAVSPSAFLRMLRMIREIDVRAVLPAIHVPTLVIQRLDDRITPPVPRTLPGIPHRRRPLFRAARGPLAAVRRKRGHRRAVRRDRGLPRRWPHRPRDRDRVLATILLATVAGPGTDRAARRTTRPPGGRSAATDAPRGVARRRRRPTAVLSGRAAAAWRSTAPGRAGNTPPGVTRAWTSCPSAASPSATAVTWTDPPLVPGTVWSVAQ